MDFNLILAAASVLLLIGLIAFFGFLVRHQEEVEPEREVHGVELLRQHYGPGETVEQPTPYFVSPIPASPDPLEISSNLDKKIVLGATMLFAIFAMFGAYFLVQPTIRARAEDTQLEKAVHRGKNLYANFCFDCHGETGQGIQGAGLPLNQPANKAANLTDPQKRQDRETLLRRTIERGRAKPLGLLSMPPWGPADGGALNDEQIGQVLAFIEYGKDEDWADIVTIRQESNLPTKPNTPPPPALPTGPAGGLALTRSNPQQACVTCHSFTKGETSPLPGAPNLSNYGNDGPLNDQLKAVKASGDKDWLLHWVSNAPSIKPGIAMPPFAQSAGGQLTDDNIKALVEYLQSLGTDKEPK